MISSTSLMTNSLSSLNWFHMIRPTSPLDVELSFQGLTIRHVISAQGVDTLETTPLLYNNTTPHHTTDHDDTSLSRLWREADYATAAPLGGYHITWAVSWHQPKIRHDYYETRNSRLRPEPQGVPQVKYQAQERSLVSPISSWPLPKGATSTATSPPIRTSASNTLSHTQPGYFPSPLGSVVPKVSPPWSSEGSNSRLLPSHALDTSPVHLASQERRHPALPVVPCPHRCQGGGVLLISPLDHPKSSNHKP